MTTLGRTDTGNSTGSISANYKYASKFTLAESMTFCRGFVYFKTSNLSAKVKMVVYSVSGGEPDALVAASSEVVGICANAWNQFNFSDTPISAGDYYIGYIIDTSSIILATQASGGTSRYNADTYSDGPADPFGSCTTATNEGCFYIESPPLDSVRLGNNIPGTSYGALSANTKFASKFTIYGGSVSISAGHVILDSHTSASTTGKMKLVIYSADGAASALVATSNEIIGWSAGAQRLDFTFSPFSATPGDYYIGPIADTGGTYHPLTTTSQSIYNADTYSDGPADPFGSATLQNSICCCWADDISYPSALIDSFETYSAASDLTRRWYYQYNISGISFVAGKNGGSALKSYDASLVIYNVARIQRLSSIRVGFWFKCDTRPSATSSLLHLMSFGNTNSENQVGLGMDTSGHLVAFKSSSFAGGNTLGTGSTVLDTSTWYWVELYTVIDSSSGSVLLEIDGVEELNLTSIDTDPQLTGTVDQVGIVSGSGAANYFDHFFIADGSLFGASLGPQYIDVLTPTEDTAYADFTPSSGSDHYAMVDDVPNDGSTTYVYGNTLGSQDRFVVSDLADNPYAINLVQIASIAIDSATNTELEIKTNIYSGAESLSGPGLCPQDSFADAVVITATDPDTDGAWNKSAVDALQAEVEITNEGSSGEARITAIIAEILRSVEQTPYYDDGTASGGATFGGEVVETWAPSYTDGVVSGGVVFGGLEVSTPENHQIDGTNSGGCTFGGTIEELWQPNPCNIVVVKGGTYRIDGELYTLTESLSFTGIGSVAAIVDCGEAPAASGDYRYDLLSVDAAGDVTVTAGDEDTTPVMPDTPADEVKLNHVLRYYGQTKIAQGDIGKIFVAPRLTRLTVTASDEELAWGETTSTLTVYCYDQYDALYAGAKTINAEIISGNGTVAPTVRTGTATSFSFTYTRGGNDPGDLSPTIQFSSPTGIMTVIPIRLLDGDGYLMI